MLAKRRGDEGIIKLGVAGGPVPRKMEDLDDRLCAKLRELGFSGIGTHFLCNPHDPPLKAIERVKAVTTAHDLTIVQSWGWWQPLVSYDESVRREGVRTLGAAVRFAHLLGAEMVLTGPGSHNPRGTWWPHPRNYEPRSTDQLVKSLREAAKVAEDRNTPIALECHVTSTLCTPERTREVIDRVDSDAVKINVDPVNDIGSFADLHDNGALIQRTFDVLDGCIAAGHAKDIYAEDRLTVHLSETVPGDGMLDYRAFLSRFAQACPGSFLLVEHLPESQVAQAVAHVRAMAAEVGVAIT